MSAVVIAFPGKGERPPAGGGEIIIYPCAEDDGCWAVDHWAENYDSCAKLGAFLDFRDAEAAARGWAAEFRARFKEGTISL